MGHKVLRPTSGRDQPRLGYLSSRPRVSVIIPVHNAAAYVEETLRSVKSQTYEDFECLVIDDGSTDDTPRLLDRHRPWIDVIRQPNRGVCAARNTGLKAARGEFIAFLDADDIWLPTKLERQVSEADARRQAGLIYCAFSILDEKKRVRAHILPTPWNSRVVGLVTLATYGLAFGATALVRRRAVDSVGLFDEALSTAADADYLWRLSRRFDAVGIREPLVLYRQHADQMHREVTAFERDMRQVLTNARNTGLSEEEWHRGMANLETRLSFAALRSRSPSEAIRHAAAAWRWCPRRLVALPAAAVARRALRGLFGKWPVVGRRDPSLTD